MLYFEERKITTNSSNEANLKVAHLYNYFGIYLLQSGKQQCLHFKRYHHRTRYKDVCMLRRMVYSNR
jgi:hypothetical protein